MITINIQPDIIHGFEVTIGRGNKRIIQKFDTIKQVNDFINDFHFQELREATNDLYNKIHELKYRRTVTESDYAALAVLREYLKNRSQNRYAECNYLTNKAIPALKHLKTLAGTKYFFDIDWICKTAEAFAGEFMKTYQVEKLPNIEFERWDDNQSRVLQLAKHPKA